MAKIKEALEEAELVLLQLIKSKKSWIEHHAEQQL